TVAPVPGGTTYLLYVRDNTLVAQEFDERAGRMRGAPRLLVDNIGRVANPPLMPTVGVSPNGILAYQTGGDFTVEVLYWLSRTGERIRESVEMSNLNPTNPSLSPDGRQLVVTANMRADREPSVWVSDVTRGVTSRLAGVGGAIGSAVWSPDGKRVAFPRGDKIYVKNADGSTEDTVLADVKGLPQSWNGRYPLYTTLPQRKLFLWPVAGGTPI